MNTPLHTGSTQPPHPPHLVIEALLVDRKLPTQLPAHINTPLVPHTHPSRHQRPPCAWAPLPSPQPCPSHLVIEALLGQGGALPYSPRAMSAPMCTGKPLPYSPHLVIEALLGNGGAPLEVTGDAAVLKAVPHPRIRHLGGEGGF